MRKLAAALFFCCVSVCQAEDDKTYILVAHNGIARVVRSYFTNMENEEYSSFGVKNCELVEYEYK